MVKYDWENEVEKQIHAMQDALPDHLQIVAVGIENIQEGEGALVEAPRGALDRADITEADIREDIMSDAERQYRRAVGEFTTLEPIQ